VTITDAAPRADVTAITRLPVVIIGAGPVGLAAAAELRERGIEPLVLEPLAASDALRDRIRYGVHVEAVSRLGMDRTRSTDRAEAPFVIRISGDVQEIRARAVIDASGTFSQPNEVIASGFRPHRPEAVASHLTHGLPDVLGADRARFAGTHTVVVGAGHSAANTLIALARLAGRVPGTTVTWLIRNETPIRVYGSEDDELDGRASIGSATRDLVESGAVTLLNRFLVEDVIPADGGRV
jgi:thioredoxin reductase